MKTLLHAFGPAADWIRFNSIALRSLAKETVVGMPPKSWAETTNVARVDAHFQARTRQPNFWAARSMFQAVASVVCAIVALALWLQSTSISSLFGFLALLLAAVSVVFGAIAVRTECPAVIAPEDYDTSVRRLWEAGDAGAKAPTFLGSGLLAAVLLADGWISSMALLNFFGQMLTPRLQHWAATVAAIAFTAFLWKLLSSAARESASASRVTQQRSLAQSTDVNEREHASAMKSHCMSTVRSDFSSGYSYTIRALTVALVAGVCVSLFYARSEVQSHQAPNAMGVSESSDSAEHAPQRTSSLASNIALTLFLIGSLFAVYQSLRGSTVLGMHSERDRVIVDRFASSNEVAIELMAHADRVKARANRVYAELGRRITQCVASRPVGSEAWPMWDVTFPAKPWSKPAEQAPKLFNA
jgi:uncharacterized membrane protein